MEKARTTLINFFEAEAHARSMTRIPDLDQMNQATKKMYSYTAKVLEESLGVTYEKELDDSDYYERYKNFPPDKPAILFKLSHYSHPKYRDVWIGYSSINNPKTKTLGVAYFVIKEKDEYLVAKRCRYTDYYSDGLKLEWVEGQGYNELTFDSLGKLIEIERYLEPDEYDHSRENYYAEM